MQKKAAEADSKFMKLDFALPTSARSYRQSSE
jgi:hypothetical protein